MSRLNDIDDVLQLPLPNNLTAEITGNVSSEIKEIPLKWLAIFRNKGKGFAGKIAGRLRVVDVSVVPNPDDSSKMEARVTTEIDVTPGACSSHSSTYRNLANSVSFPDMCNAQGTLEKGCIVFLIDE
jgi:acyl-coenzyme A thioesterase 13